MSSKFVEGDNVRHKQSGHVGSFGRYSDNGKDIRVYFEGAGAFVGSWWPADACEKVVTDNTILSIGQKVKLNASVLVSLHASERERAAAGTYTVVGVEQGVYGPLGTFTYTVKRCSLVDEHVIAVVYREDLTLVEE